MQPSGIDILMVTYDRPTYTQRALGRLLETCDESMRVWLWHNGDHAETLEVIQPFLEHPRLHRFHHSAENLRLRPATNWLWSEARGEYLAKVDDDNLMPDGWGQTLRAAHEACPKLGVIGCWSFRPEDHRPEVAEKKVVDLGGGHRLLQNCWVAGTGHLLKRRCIEDLGRLADGQSFTNWCVHGAARGWIHGWYYPFLYMEDMSDPRSPYTELKTEEDFQAQKGLSAQKWGVKSLEQIRGRQPRHALMLQSCSTNPSHYIGWQGRIRRAWRRLTGGEF